MQGLQFQQLDTIPVWGWIAILCIIIVILVIQQVINGARLRKVFKQTQDIMGRQEHLDGRLDERRDQDHLEQQQITQKIETQSQNVLEVMSTRLFSLSKDMGERLHQQALHTETTMGDLKERLSVVGSAQKNLETLSGQIVDLQSILSNKQARGAFGEMQLEHIVQDSLAPDDYQFQAVLSNGRRADCLLLFPEPMGKMAIDAKFPLENYRRMVEAQDKLDKAQKAKVFGQDVMKHVKAISERYIVAGETASYALMFLPSEIIFASLHTDFPDIVEKAMQMRVYIVSPATLMGTLQAVRSALRDVKLTKSADFIRKQLQLLERDTELLIQRVEALKKSFAQSTKAVDEISTSTHRIIRRAQRITDLEDTD